MEPEPEPDLEMSKMGGSGNPAFWFGEHEMVPCRSECIKFGFGLGKSVTQTLIRILPELKKLKKKKV